MPIRPKNSILALPSSLHICQLPFRFGHTAADRVNSIFKIFKTWLLFMYWKFKDLSVKMFKKRSQIRKPLPRAFRNSLLKNTRVVIDCRGPAMGRAGRAIALPIIPWLIALFQRDILNQLNDCSKPPSPRFPPPNPDLWCIHLLLFTLYLPHYNRSIMNIYFQISNF